MRVERGKGKGWGEGREKGRLGRGKKVWWCLVERGKGRKEKEELDVSGERCTSYMT